MFPFFNGYFYYVTIGLQAICAIHCIRRGTQQKWIYLIVFLPLVGSIAYIYTEMFNRPGIRNFQSGFSGFVSPAGRIRRLENNLRFTDTFNHRVRLADAYLAAGRTDSAIELYESSLTGAFEENEYVLRQLIIAYFQQQAYAKLIPLAKKIYNRPEFVRSRAHILYAISLGYMGDAAGAEQEFRKMKARFSYFEARYEYGLFLRRAGREAEARAIFGEIIDEASHLSSRERRDSRPWIAQAKSALKKV